MSAERKIEFKVVEPSPSFLVENRKDARDVMVFLFARGVLHYTEKINSSYMSLTREERLTIFEDEFLNGNSWEVKILKEKKDDILYIKYLGNNDFIKGFFKNEDCSGTITLDKFARDMIANGILKGLYLPAKI